MNVPNLVTRNLRLKAVSAVLATATWGGVVFASNPPDSRAVSLKVPQESGSITPFVLVHPIPDVVVRVSGTREHLTSFQPSDLVLTINYRAIRRAGVQQIPISITNNDRDVSLDDNLTAVTADVDHLDSRTTPVTILVSAPPPQGYVVSAQATSPSTVSVIGPQQALASLQARVSVDLSNQRTNYQADQSVQLFDATGHRLGDFGVNPGTVQVSIGVTASITSRGSAVLPRVTGAVGSGFQLGGLSVDPLTVVLTGPQDLLNTLDSVPTDPISLAGLSGDRTFTVHLAPPSGVSSAPGTVNVLVRVLPVPSQSPAPTAAPTPTPTPTPTPPQPT